MSSHWIEPTPVELTRPQPVQGTSSTVSTAELTRRIANDRALTLERILELTRWMVIIAVTLVCAQNDVSLLGPPGVVVGAWAVINIYATLNIFARHVPPLVFRYATTVFDVAGAATLLSLPGSPWAHTGAFLYITTLLGLNRFSSRTTVIGCALAFMTYAACLYVTTYSVTGDHVHFALDVALFLTLTVMASLLVHEVVLGRQRQITQTVLLEESSQRSQDALNRVKSEFIMLASHELRTPLTTMKGWLALLQKHQPPEGNTIHDEALAELTREAEHLERLTDNLLCIAQIETGEMRIATTSVNLETALGQSIARFHGAFPQASIIRAIDPHAARVIADPDKLVLLLTCILDNALKFSPRDQPVTVTTRRSGALVEIRIHDNGRPIPTTDTERVFASFYQVESPLIRQRGGFGVGLHLARQLSERMGGTITLDLNSRTGNTFLITLPTAEP